MVFSDAPSYVPLPSELEIEAPVEADSPTSVVGTSPSDLQGLEVRVTEAAYVGLRAEYPIWLEHKCSRIYNFYPLTHQGSHAFHKKRRKGKRSLPLVDRFVKPSKSASWFIRIFKGAAFLKSDHPLQVSTHEQIMNDVVEC